MSKKGETKLKIPAVRIASDDCEVYVGRVYDNKTGEVKIPGTPYHVHKGEWVEVIQVNSISQYLDLMSLTLSGAAAQDTTRPIEERIASAEKIEQAYNDMCAQLACMITGWNWTDMAGNPLPQPYNNPAVIRRLANDEIAWLRQAVQGETPGQRKNGSGPSTGK